MNAGRSRGTSSVAVFLGGLAVAFAMEEDVAFRGVGSTDVLAGFETPWDALVTAVVLARATGRLLATVEAEVVVAIVDVDAMDPADGGRGGRVAVVEVRAVAVDFGRGRVVRGAIGLAVDEAKAGLVVLVGEGRDAIPEEGFDVNDDVDVGRASLVVADAVGRAVLVVSASSLEMFCVTGLRAAVESDRPRPKTPEFGLLLVAIPLPPGPDIPARVLVAVEVPPGLGSRLGDMLPGSAAAGAGTDDAGTPRPLLLSWRSLSARRGASFLSSSFLCA